MRVLFVILSIVPGSHAILTGHTVRGVLWMAIAFVGWDFAFLGYSGLWLGAPPWLAPASLGVAVWSTVWSVGSTIIETSPSRRRRRAQRVETSIREAAAAYVRGDLRTAAACVDRGLAVDREDIDLVHLDWQIALAEGDEPRARRLLKRLVRLDEEGKWSWETEGA